MADLDRRIGLQIDALEKGIEPELIGARIAELRAEKEEIESRLRQLPHPPEDTDATELEAALARTPDLTQALQQAPPELKRAVFDAFELRITYDKITRRIEISATIIEAVAKTLQNGNDLPKEAVTVTHKDIAGARIVRRSDARVVEEYRLAA